MRQQAGDNWIQTFTGRRFYLPDPDPTSICIEDIAHALSLKCRFGGHCREFYSVAQHSVHVAAEVPPRYRLQALLHDAAEAYLPDVCCPIKPMLPGFAAIERAVSVAIFRCFKVPDIGHDEVKRADNQLLATEARDLMGTTDGWYLPEPPLPRSIRVWPSSQAERTFRGLFDLLQR